MRRFVSKFLMFFVILLMLLQPVRAEASQYFADDTYACLNATKKLKKNTKSKSTCSPQSRALKPDAGTRKNSSRWLGPGQSMPKARDNFSKPKLKLSRQSKNCRLRALKALTSGVCRLISHITAKLLKALKTP